MEEYRQSSNTVWQFSQVAAAKYTVSLWQRTCSALPRYLLEAFRKVCLGIALALHLVVFTFVDIYWNLLPLPPSWVAYPFGWAFQFLLYWVDSVNILCNFRLTWEAKCLQISELSQWCLQHFQCQKAAGVPSVTNEHFRNCNCTDKQIRDILHYKWGFIAVNQLLNWMGTTSNTVLPLPQ